MKTIPQNQNPLQACRIARAEREAANYTCRTTTIAGFLAVFVINERNEKIYTVNHLRRCNCDDFQGKCARRGIVCKHVILADQHLEQDGAPVSGAAVPYCDPFAPAIVPDLAALDAEEARFAQIRRDIDALWP